MARKQKAPKPLIKAASIATVLEKVTNKILGFLVKSNSSEDYYQIQLMDIAGERVFFCDCEAHLWGCAECCHIKAVKEVLAAKAELAKQEEEHTLAQPTCNHWKKHTITTNQYGPNGSCYWCANPPQGTNTRLLGRAPQGNTAQACLLVRQPEL